MEILFRLRQPLNPRQGVMLCIGDRAVMPALRAQLYCQCQAPIITCVAC
jgi:hypothetical protein